MIGRRAFINGSTVALLGIAFGALAQPGATMPRIALLLPTRIPLEPAFREALRELGYVEGKTIAIERRSADGDFTRLPALATELVSMKPEVIVAFVTQASIAAKQATLTIPIVMVGVADPVASQLVGNLARPGGNVTGTAGQNAAVVGKQLESIRELRPSATRVATLWNPANAVFQQQLLREARAGAQRLGLQLRLVEARTATDVERAFAALATERPDAVLVLSDPLFVAHAKQIGELVLKHRLVAVGGTRDYAEAGMLAIYGPNLLDSSRRAATYVDRILRGAKPAELSVELATKFELIVNAKTAGLLGVTVSPALIARADEMIQ